jgi:glutamyl-tRNA reductase
MKAVNTGRRTRTETRINEGSVSVSSAAVDLAAKMLGDLKSASALIVGAGEAGSIAAETLRRRGIGSILIANRTYEKGFELASKVSGKAIRFNAIYDTLQKVDVAIVAASVSQPILKAKEIRKALAGADRSKSLCLIDISQPRAVEEKAGLVKGLVLRNIEDLKEIVEESVRNRKAEAERVKRIVFDELERFQKELSKLMVEPLISEIYRKVEALRQKELERAVRKMAESDSRKLAILDRFSRELVERIMQVPVEQLNEAALEDERGLLSAAEKLFKIKNQNGEKN